VQQANKLAFLIFGALRSFFGIVFLRTSSDRVSQTSGTLNASRMWSKGRIFREYGLLLCATGLLFLLGTPIVEALADEPSDCYTLTSLVDMPWVNLSILLHDEEFAHRRTCALGSTHHRMRQAYALPRSSERVLLHPTAATIENDATFFLIHVNKCGGSSLKALFEQVARGRGWRTSRGATPKNPVILNLRNQVMAGLSPTTDLVAYGHAETWVSFIQRITGQRLDGQPLGEGKIMGDQPRTRLISGALALGLGDLFVGGKRSAYLISLRDPLSRVISEYDFFAMKGRGGPGGQVKWTEEMKASGSWGDTGIVEFLEQGIGSANLAVTRLSHGCGVESCAPSQLETAKRNLLHPCVRYLLLDKMGDGLSRLGSQWGSFFSESAALYNRSPFLENVRVDTDPATLKQLEHPVVLRRLQELLAPDIALFNFAVSNYFRQWEQPIALC